MILLPGVLNVIMEGILIIWMNGLNNKVFVQFKIVIVSV
jgi:hypothetical protein